MESERILSECEETKAQFIYNSKYVTKFSDETRSQLDDCDAELQGLITEENKLKETLQELEKLKQEKIEQYRKDSLKLQEQINIKKGNEREASEKALLIAQFNERKKKALAKPSEKDMSVLHKLEQKILAYRDLTGIYWDFHNMEAEKLCGYIKNFNNNKLKLFEFNRHKETIDAIKLKLWGYIKEINSIDP